MKEYTKVRLSIVLLALILTLTLAPGRGLSENAQVDMKKIRAILISPDSGQAVERAAGELQQSFQKMYGKNVPINPKGLTISADTRDVVMLGSAAAKAAGMIMDRELDKVKWDGYVIKIKQGRIAIAGPRDRATVYGIYGFLEQLGVRYFLRSQAIFPKSPPLLIQEASISDKPVFQFRTLYSPQFRSSRDELGDPKNGMNSELFGKGTGSDLWVDHTAGYLVPKNLYYDTHPEYYSLKSNGKRIGKDEFTDHRTPLCLSNPDVQSISRERALGWIEKEKDKRFFMISYGDTLTMCTCSECTKLDTEQGSFTDRIFNWVNGIAREVEKKYPDKVLITFSYLNHSKLPKKEGMAQNVSVAKATSLGNYPFFDEMLKYNPDKISKAISELDEWNVFTKGKLQVCEYDGQYYPVLLDNWAERLRFYAKRGIYGINATYGRPTNFPLLWEYVFAKLQWDPHQDYMKLQKDFIEFYYGKAAPALWKYFGLVHDWHKNGDYDKTQWNDLYPRGFYGEEFTKKALAYFNEAEQLADDKKMRDEIMKEELLFIHDWMAHPVSTTLDTKSQETIGRQLSRLFAINAALASDRMEFLRAAYKIPLQVYGQNSDILFFVKKWISENNIPKPEVSKVPGGIRIGPEQFLDAGFGINITPLKKAAGIFPKGNEKNFNNWIEAYFNGEEVADRDDAVLELEGQDCYSPLPRNIKIELNGKTIFDNPMENVVNNWSKQTFKIPIGILKRGENLLTITNMKKDSRWRVGCFLIAEAVIRSGKK